MTFNCHCNPKKQKTQASIISRHFDSHHVARQQMQAIVGVTLMMVLVPLSTLES
jgi:hypothetical protein